MTDGIERLREAIGKARRARWSSPGAGISTESGIPDFRSPGGVWDRYKPIMFDDFISSEEMRRETWRRKIETDKTMVNARPNRGHRAVAALVERGIVSAVITQNIDGLHQASGVPDDKVIELHGNSTYAACLDCRLRHELDDILSAFRRDETLPVLQRLRRHGENGRRSPSARPCRKTPCAGPSSKRRARRPVHRLRLLAGGLSGGGASPSRRNATAPSSPSSTASRPTLTASRTLPCMTRSGDALGGAVGNN